MSGSSSFGSNGGSGNATVNSSRVISSSVLSCCFINVVQSKLELCGLTQRSGTTPDKSAPAGTASEAGSTRANTARTPGDFTVRNAISAAP